MPIYDDIKAVLIKHGWAIDTMATERPDGEVREFVHPRTGRRLAYIDATQAQMDLEIETTAQQPDPRPGFYYVSALPGIGERKDKYWLLAGPWPHTRRLDSSTQV